MNRPLSHHALQALSQAEEHAHLTQLRQDLHRWPEMGFEENRTADRIAMELGLLGIPFTRGVGRTGIVGMSRGPEVA